MPEGRPLVLFTRPEHAKEIFAGDPEVFHAGKGNAILGPIMGEHSLLLLRTAAEHKRARKLLMPAFNGHGAARLRGPGRPASPRTRSARWRRATPFRSLDRMNALTLEVILRVVFGVTDEAPARRAAAAGQRAPSTSARWCCWAGATRCCRGSAPWKRAVENQHALDRLIYAEIPSAASAPDLAERTDVLSRLIRVGTTAATGSPTTELRDQLVTLLLAGHETTATALAWALYELGRDPAQRRRAQRGRRGPGTTTSSRR